MNLDEPYDVVAATFAREDGAALALEALQRAAETELLDIENAAIIVKDAEGEVTLTETEDKTGWQGLGRGLLIGGLTGLLLPGKMFATSALKQGAGSAFMARLNDTGFEDDDLRAMAEDLEPGSSMLVAIVQYQLTDEVRALLQQRQAAIATAPLAPEGARVLAEAGKAVQTPDG